MRLFYEKGLHEKKTVFENILWTQIGAELSASA